MFDLETMPPIGAPPEETEEQRKARLARLPAVTPAQPSSGPSTPASVMPAVPLASAHPAANAAPPARRPDEYERIPGSENGWRLKRAPEAGASPSALPAVPVEASTLAPPTPRAAPTATAMPPVGRAEMAAPAVNPSAMPPVPVQPAAPAAAQPPELHGWKKALDVVGSMFPIGRAIETAIPGSPQNFNMKQAMEAARTETGQKIAQNKQALEKGESEAQFNTPEKRRAYLQAHPDEFEGASDFQKNDFVLAGKFPQKEPAEEKPHDVVKQYSDALAAGDEQKAADLLPRVKQFIENTQKPAKEPVDTAKDKDISDYLEANKLPDTAGNREKARGAIAQRTKTEVNPTDAKDIASAIARGDQPPTTTGLYRNAAAVRAELGRMGFNLAQAESDWHATQKHLATLNGQQQERLRQAVTFTSDSLGIIQGLYDQWLKVGKTSGWKDFNKASLATAKHLPGDAGNIANRLDAQINDLTAELGTVYKGGNSSTDESLKLAAQNLKSEWNEKTFKNAVDQIRQNLTIRMNSIRHSQPMGVSANSPYTPTSETPPAPEKTPGGFADWKKNQGKPQ